MKKIITPQILLAIFFAVIISVVFSGSTSAQFNQPDTTPPWVTRWAVTNITPYSATVTWTTDEPSDGMVEFCTSWVNCANFTLRESDDYITNHTINLSNLNPNTRYYIWMYSRDIWGNLRIYGYRTFNTAWVASTPSPTPTPSIFPTPSPTPTPYPSQSPVPTPDTTPPWVTGWAVTNITPFAATINWTTDEPTDAMVEFCFSWVNCNNFTPLISGLTSNHSINLSGLAPGTRYYFWLYSRDQAGNLRIYGYRTFNTQWVLPTPSPTPLPTPVPTNTPWPTPFPSQSPIPTPDTTPPWVTRWAVTDITANTAVVNWSTDELTNAKVEFCTTWVNCGNFTTLDPSYLIDHRFGLTNLNSNTRYYIWMYSEDRSGNLRIYGYKTFNTAWVPTLPSPTPIPSVLPTPTPRPTPYPTGTPLPLPDTTPPWVMRWTVNNITTSSAQVEWITDEPADGQVEFCASWVNCGNFTSLNSNYSTGHNASLNNLEPYKRYYIWMYSRDRAGNLRIYGYRTFMTAWGQ